MSRKYDAAMSGDIRGKGLVDTRGFRDLLVKSPSGYNKRCFGMTFSIKDRSSGMVQVVSIDVER